MAYKNFTECEFIDEIGAELKKVRTGKGLRIREAAEGIEKLGVSTSITMIGRIENGLRRIDDRVLRALCDFYEIDRFELLIRAAQKHIDSLRMKQESEGLERAAAEAQKEVDVPAAEEFILMLDHINDTGKKDLVRVARLMAYMSAYKADTAGPSGEEETEGD